MARLPASTALATATTMPRSLKDPVGLQPSSLKYSSPQPSSFSRYCDRTSGVSPSPRLTIGVAAVTGRYCLYLGRTPKPMSGDYRKEADSRPFSSFLFLM